MKEISLQSSHISIPATTRQAIEGATKDFYESGIEAALQDYPDTWGDAVLRERIDAMTPTWGGEVLVTGSATQALNLALNTIGKDRTIAVRVPVYFGVLRKARELGLEVKTWETIDELEAIGKFDAVLVSSNFTPPTGKSFTADEKAKIAEAAGNNGTWLIEDNVYDPLWRDACPEPVPYDPDRTIRIGSLSKIAAPGFRLGFIKASAEVMKSLRSAKITLDLSSSIIPQILARDTLQKNVLDTVRRETQQRVDLLRGLLQEKTGVEITQPDGGPFVCLPMPKEMDIKVFQTKLAAIGLKIDANDQYYPDGKNRPYVRLNAGAANMDEIRIAAHRISMALDAMTLGIKDLTQEFMSQASDSPLQGKVILVTGGQVKENIDGVRHFSNTKRPEGQGHQLAEILAKLGAKVILVTAKTRLAPPPGVLTISHTVDGRVIQNTTDLIEMAGQVANLASVDAAVSLACVPSLRFATEADHKLKVKGTAQEEVKLKVRENVSSLLVMPKPSIGFDQYQNFHGAEDDIVADEIVKIMGSLNEADAPVAPKEKIKEGNYISHYLSGKKIIVTSGNTHEVLTPSGDIITNFASGRQGHAIAQALEDMGAQVSLVTGPNLMKDPVGPVKTTHILTAEDLKAACLAELPADAAVCVCAVGDFKVKEIKDIEFDADGFADLIVEQNPDILKTLGLHETQRPGIVIGFAAETHDLLKYATDKLERKGADAICANHVGNGQTHDVNTIQFVTRTGVEAWEECGKDQVGFMIGKKIMRLSEQKSANRKLNAPQPLGPV